MTKGFTLLEMALTIAVIAILSGISAPIFMSFVGRNDLNVTTNVVVQSLRRAQSLSLSMESNQSWGVYLESKKVTIFKGLNYVSRDASFDEIFDIAPTISFSGLDEVVFDRFTGDTPNSGNIIINSINNETKTITINQKGMLEY